MSTQCWEPEQFCGGRGRHGEQWPLLGRQGSRPREQRSHPSAGCVQLVGRSGWREGYLDGRLPAWRLGPGWEDGGGLTALSQWRLFAGVVTQGDASLLGARPTLEAEGESGPGGDREDPQAAILPSVASCKESFLPLSVLRAQTGWPSGQR